MAVNQFDLQRMADIMDAVTRHFVHNKAIPIEWIEQYNELTKVVDEGPDTDINKPLHYASGVNTAMRGLNCHECCISCDKDKKQCEDYKERSRAVNRTIYRGEER